MYGGEVGAAGDGDLSRRLSHQFWALFPLQLTRPTCDPVEERGEHAAFELLSPTRLQLLAIATAFESYFFFTS